MMPYRENQTTEPYRFELGKKRGRFTFVAGKWVDLDEILSVSRRASTWPEGKGQHGVVVELSSGKALEWWWKGKTRSELSYRVELVLTSGEDI